MTELRFFGESGFRKLSCSDGPHSLTNIAFDKGYKKAPILSRCQPIKYSCAGFSFILSKHILQLAHKFSYPYCEMTGQRLCRDLSFINKI